MIGDVEGSFLFSCFEILVEIEKIGVVFKKVEFAIWLMSHKLDAVAILVLCMSIEMWISGNADVNLCRRVPSQLESMDITEVEESLFAASDAKVWMGGECIWIGFPENLNLNNGDANL